MQFLINQCNSSYFSKMFIIIFNEAEKENRNTVAVNLLLDHFHILLEKAVWGTEMPWTMRWVKGMDLNQELFIAKVHALLITYWQHFILLGSHFCFINLLYVFVPVPYYFDYCTFVV